MSFRSVNVFIMFVALSPLRYREGLSANAADVTSFRMICHIFPTAGRRMQSGAKRDKSSGKKCDSYEMATVPLGRTCTRPSARSWMASGYSTCSTS